MRSRSKLTTSLFVVVGLIAGLLTGVAATIVDDPTEALAVPAPTSPLPSCVIDDNGNEGLGCLPGNEMSIVSGTYAAGSTFTIDAGQLGLGACATYVSTGCYYDVYTPSLYRCVYLYDNDPTDVRSCSGSLSSSGSVSAVRQGVCRGSLGSTYASGGPTPETFWSVRGPVAAACEYAVEGTGEIDNLRGPTFYLARASVDECIEPGNGYGCDESWATLERHTGYAWIPVEGDLAPVARFETKEHSTPGVYSFTNKSTPFASGGTTYEWDLGDGETSTATSPTHTYEVPGWKRVVLTMIGDERTLTASEWIYVEPLGLTISVVNPEAVFGGGGDGNNLDLNEEFPVLVSVTSNNGIGSLTEVGPADDTLFDELPPEVEAVALGDTSVVPDEVGPNERYLIRSTMKAVNGGRFTLGSTWVAQTDDGPASFDGELNAAVRGLGVTIALDPAKVEQTDAEDDEPVPVNITVTIENVSGSPIDNVTLRSLGVERRVVGQAVDYDWVDPEVDPPAGGLEVELLPGADPKVTPIDSISGLVLPDIPKDQAVVVHAKVIMNDDGVFDVKAQAQAAGPTGDTISGVGEAKLEVDPEYYLKFETELLRPLPTENLLPAGDAIRVKGSIENVTTTATIEVGTPYPLTEGNAGAMIATWNPTSETSAGSSPIDTVELAPGEKIEFLVRITTGMSDPRPGGTSNPSGGTRAYLEFTPWGIATLEDGSEVDVLEDLVDTTDEQVNYTISIDDSIEIPETDELALAGAIFLGGLEGTVNAVGALIAGIIEAPYMVYSALRTTAEFQTKVWNSFSDAEKADFQDSSAQLIASVLYRNYEFARRDGPELYDQVYQYVGRQMTDLATEWETGDYLSTARAYSAAGSEAIGSVALPMALNKLATSPQAVAALNRWQAAKQARLAEVSGEIAAIEKLDDAARILQVVEAGVELTTTQIAKLYGIGADDAAELLRFAEKYKVLITVRSRHATSLKWVKFYNAMFKPEALKVKSVSDLDVELGYPADRLGSLVFKKPDVMVLHGDVPSASQIDDFVRSKGFAPDTPEYENAVSRVVQRVDEWKKYEKTYKQWDDRGYIETSFDFEGNNADIANLSTDKKFNGFRMRRTSPDGDPYEIYDLQLFDAKQGKWRPVTGDIDPIAFTKLDGSPLSAFEHKIILEEMIKSPQLRAIHGETATFSKTIYNADGSIKKRLGGLDLIESQFKPGEAGIQFAPQALPRTVRFNKDKSRWNDAFDYDLHWDGGFVQANKPTVTRGQSGDRGVSLVNGRAPVQAPDVVDVGVPRPPAASAPSEPNFGSCRITSTGGEAPTGAIVVRSSGELVRIESDGSSAPAGELKSQCFSEGNTEVTQVTSGAVTNVQPIGGGGEFRQPLVAAGAVSVGVVDSSEFTPGDVVVVGALTSAQEMNTVVNVVDGSLRLQRPLESDHASGAVIAAVDRVVLGGVLPVSPARLVDTRDGQSTVDGQLAGVGRVGAGEVLRVPVHGRGGVPDSATSVVVNTVAVGPDGIGFLTHFPCDGERPLTSSVNYGFRPLDVNNALVKLSAGGDLCIYSERSTHLVMDVTAYAEGAEALAPKRLAESRVGQSTDDGVQAGFGRVAAGSVTEVQVAGRGGVPADAAAVAVNVTAVRPAERGFLTLFPCGREVPVASNLNYTEGSIRPNSAIVALSGEGTLCVFSFAATDLIVDVTASFASVPSFSALAPARLVDSRDGQQTVDDQNAGFGRVEAGSVTAVQVAGRGGVPADAAAVALNVTAIRPDGRGFMTLFPCDEDQPNASSMNFVAGDVIANSGVVKLAADGSVCVFSNTSTHLAIDVNAAWAA